MQTWVIRFSIAVNANILYVMVNFKFIEDIFVWFFEQIFTTTVWHGLHVAQNALAKTKMSMNNTNISRVRVDTNKSNVFHSQIECVF